MDNKLDLSPLTDEEAKHVWEVIQRDFSLRKIEEERLGDLKTKIEKEDSKRELLGSETPLVESHCIRCLQPFKFLVNSKRQCLDCKVFTCKSCSRYNKKEMGWVCDPCRMTRVLKMGTAGWYHDNVRTRFKRFGSAKVMKSLYKRLNREGGREDEAQSMPDIRHSYNNGYEEEAAEVEAQKFRMIRKNRRLLSVHPLDLDMEDYFPLSSSRRPSFQMDRGGYRNEAEYHNDMYLQRTNRRKSLDKYMRQDEARSLSKISSSMARQQYVDTSEEEEYLHHPVYQPPHRRRASRGSQENLGANPPINELNKRMSAIEGLLNRLEQRMSVSPEDENQTSTQLEEAKLRRKLDELASTISDKGSSTDEDMGRKPPLAKGTSSGPSVPPPQDPELSSSSDEMRSQAQKRSTAAALCDITTEVLRTINATESAMTECGYSKPVDRSLLAVTDVKQADEAYRQLEENVYLTAGQSFDLERKLRLLEKSTKNCFGATDSELSELEDALGVTAAKVQNTESEVSDIENKIAALSVPGVDKSNKKVAGMQQRQRFTQDPPTKTSFFSRYRRNSMNI